MIKVYALLPKRPDISAGQFHEHWSTVHREHALAITRLRRYVQAHRIDDEMLSGLEQAPYDGIPEVWYDSLESAVGQDDDPDYVEGAKRDEPNFVDMNGIAWVMTDERLVRDDLDLEAEPDSAKALILVHRSEGLDRETFAATWPAAAQTAMDALPGVRRAAVATTLPETYDAAEPAYDGVLELWWADRETFRADWEAAGSSTLDALEDVIARKRSHGAVVRELRVIWPGPSRAGAATPQEEA